MPRSSLIRRRAGVVVPFVAALLSAALLAPAAGAKGGDWPRQFESTSGTFTVYQPQPEQLSGDTISARAAFMLQKHDSTAARFGVLWYQAHVQIDRDSSNVTETDLDVTTVRLPGAPDAEARRYEHLVEAEATGWDLSGSLRELQAGLAASAKERLSVEGLDHTPPRIVHSTRRALLVPYDGAPQLEAIEGSSLERVANTPYAVVFDPASGAYYLGGADLWYRAADPLGPWSVTASPPREVAEMLPPDTSAADQIEGPPPEVITATEPTELIVTDGEPLMAPLVGSRLLYVTNTESDVLRDMTTKSIYVLLSGRWYEAPSLAGPWTYVAADALPAVFAQIPPDSPKGNLLASVPGTEAADDAVADNEIPQTSEVSRDDHEVDVEWDGDPQFQAIEGTRLEYGLNTDAQVILADGRYYLCDQGVWYVADAPVGPWSVSEVRPLGLEDLEPGCPVYNLRYVEIYRVTPEFVTVGYLPGYLGYYSCRGTVVYGTGYHYRAWRSRHHYYPRPYTWGFHACYNPWLGRWSFGLSYWSGFLRVSYRWHPGPGPRARRHLATWLGPGGYHRPLLAENHSMLRSRPVRTRTRLDPTTPQNLYTRAENRRRLPRAGTTAPRVRQPDPGRRVKGADNVFAGRDGKVYRRERNGKWSVNEGRKWVPASVPPSPLPPVVPVGKRERSDDRGAGPEVKRPAVTPVPVQPAPRQRTPGTPAPIQPAPVQPAPTPPPRPTPTPVPPAQQPRERPQPPAPRPERTPPAPAPAVQPTRSPEPASSPGALDRDARARERAGGQASPARPPEQTPAKKEEPPAKKEAAPGKKGEGRGHGG